MGDGWGLFVQDAANRNLLSAIGSILPKAVPDTAA
jgi:hypothetical protein